MERIYPERLAADWRPLQSKHGAGVLQAKLT